MAESAAFARRGFAGGAARTTLPGGIAAGDLTIACTNLASWSSTFTNGPATAILNRGQSDEEVIEYTGIAGNSLTGCTRGIAGTTAQTHSAGATVEHGYRVRDFDEANRAVAKTLGLISGNAAKFYRVNAAATDIEVVTLAGTLVANTPAGNIAATDVQAAINELDTEKAGLAGATFTGAVVVPDEVYGVGWNGSAQAPTKNAVYDKIELVASAGAPTSIWVPAGAFAALSGSPALTTGSNYVGWQFDAASSEIVHVDAGLTPTGWASAAVDLYWTNPSSTSGNVRWDVYFGNFGDGELMNLGSADTQTIAAPAVAHTAKVSTFHAAGKAQTVGEVMTFAVTRLGADAADTLANDATLVGALVRKVS